MLRRNWCDLWTYTGHREFSVEDRAGGPNCSSKDGIPIQFMAGEEWDN